MLVHFKGKSVNMNVLSSLNLKRYDIHISAFGVVGLVKLGIV